MKKEIQKSNPSIIELKFREEEHKKIMDRFEKDVKRIDILFRVTITSMIIVCIATFIKLLIQQY